MFPDAILTFMCMEFQINYIHSIVNIVIPINESHDVKFFATLKGPCTPKSPNIEDPPGPP